MEFYIRQGASDPILKMRMIDDGKNDKSQFNELVENAVISFDMIDTQTGNIVIYGAECELANRVKKYHYINDEYYITFRFTEEQTNEPGRYEGKITIQFNDGNGNNTTKLILPIREKLYINIF